MIKQLQKRLPLTILNIEDIQAVTKVGQKKWNASFSPLEVGKAYFERRLILPFIKTQGYKTFEHRNLRGFKKSGKKLDFTWEAHNVDSHVLCEMALAKEIKPYKGLYQINYLQFPRRELQRQNPNKGGIRSPYGGTVSLGTRKGAVVKYRGKFCTLSSTTKLGTSLYRIVYQVGKPSRFTQTAKREDIKIMYQNSKRVQFLPCLKAWVSLHKFS